MGVETVMAAAAFASAAGGVLNGYNQYKDGKYQHDQDWADAQAAEGASQVQASRIRLLATRQQSSARAGLAASGVDVNQGGGQQIQNAIGQYGDQDALTAVFNGNTTAQQLRAQGSMAALQGKQALIGSVLSAAGKGASAYGSWSKMGTS